MIRKLSIVLFAIGFVVFAYSGLNYFQATQSVQEIPEEAKAASMDITANQTAATMVDQKKVETSNDDTGTDPLTLHHEIEKGAEVATLDIPAMDKRFTTYWGTDEDTLDQGVGMYVSEWTTVPNDDHGHTVLSGHRDTVFTGLDKLRKGDTLKVHYNNETFEYEITKTWITNADDRTVIVEKEQPTLTLTTCYPFDFVGFAPDRYIVEAVLVE